MTSLADRAHVLRGPLSFSIRGDFQYADHQMRHEILSVTRCCAWHTNLYKIYRMSAIWRLGKCLSDSRQK